MGQVAAVVLFAGLGLTGFALVFLLAGLVSRRTVRALDRVGPTPIGSWRGGGRVSAEGVTAAGPGGPLLAPLSGAESVWWHLHVVRRGSDGANPADPQRQFAADAWPLLTDATGSVPIDPRLIRGRMHREPDATVTTTAVYSRSNPRPLPSIVPADLVRGLRRGDQLHLTEVSLPPGVPVFAMGRLTPRGLSPGGRGPNLLTTTSHADVLAERRAGFPVENRTVAVCAVAGLLLSGAGAAVLVALQDITSRR